MGVPVVSQSVIFFLSSLLKRDQDRLYERSIGTTLWCLVHLQMRLNRWNGHIDWWNSSPMNFSVKTCCWSVSHTIRRSLRMSLPTPIMSPSLSSLYVKSCGMPTNEDNEQNWLFKAFTVIACSSATVDCCYLPALLFRLEEWVLFWPPWMSTRNGTVLRTWGWNSHLFLEHTLCSFVARPGHTELHKRAASSGWLCAPSPTVVEAVSLLGIQRQRKKECSFQRSNLLLSWGTTESLRSWRKWIEGRRRGKHSTPGLVLSLKTTFLLKYHEKSNGSSTAPPYLGDE